MLHKESLRVILLDTRYHLLRIEEVSIGSVNESIAHPREVFRPAMISSAYAVIVVHNHPSGDPSPSQADHSLTRRLTEAAELLQISLLDHIIIGAPAEGRRRLFQFQGSGRAVSIHPTAIVDSKAQIGADVEIGAYSIIGPQVVIGDKIRHRLARRHRRRRANGRAYCHWSRRDHRQRAAGFGLQFPDAQRRTTSGITTSIREYCTIHRGTAEGSMTTIGDKNFLMVGAHVGHNCTIGSNVIIANNCLLGGYVEIQDNAFLGGGCVFHQFIRVGRLAITQGGSAFSVDVPPFIMAARLNLAIGLNVVGLKRAGFAREDRDELKAAFKVIYTSGLNTSQALAQASEKNWGVLAREFFDFVASAKKRGICAYRGSDRKRAD